MTDETEEPAPASGRGRHRRIAVVASLTLSLTNFRLELLKRMVEAGHEVIAFAPERDADVERTLTDIGVRFIRIPMQRASLNPLADLHTLVVLWRQFRRTKPDTILPYTVKPIIYGCLAARIAGIPNRFALVTGLGKVFTDIRPSIRMALARRASIRLFRLALSGAKKVFVYNEADAEEFRRLRIVGDPSRLMLVPGSGVDLERYTRSEPPLRPLTFLLIARLLRDKGIVEYVEAARQLRAQGCDARVQLLGPFDTNPSGISRADVEGWVAEGAIDYLGETRDVRPFLTECTVFVLPSYREGIPRTVLEAMSTGRPVITTDAPGCRDTVIHGETGYIVRARDSDDLAAAMRKFVADPERAVQMGEAAYRLARARFDVHQVNRLLLDHMKLI